MKKKDGRVAIGILLFICPIGALPFIFKEIYEKRYYALGYLAVFMALLGYLWIPSGDLYRFYLDYDIISNMNFKEMVEYSKFDIFVQALTWLFSRFNLNYEWFRFIICISCYSIVFSVTRAIISNNKYGNDKITHFAIFLIVFFLFKFSAFLTGARFSIASVLLFYSNYYLFVSPRKKILKSWLAVIVACLTHFAFIPVAILLLLAKLLNPRLKKQLVFILCALGLAVSETMLIFLIDYLPLGDAIMSRLDYYTTGYFAQGELESHSLFFRFSQILSISSLYFFILISLFKIKDFSTCQVFAMLLIFLTLLVNMNSAYNRYAGIAILVFLPSFLQNSFLFYKRKHLTMLLVLSFVIYIGSIWNTKRELKYGHQKLIFLPTLVILNHQYDDYWISSNIEPNGNILKAN